MSAQLSASIKRIKAVIYRHYAYMRRTPLQLLDMIIGPSMGILVWGFMSQYFRQISIDPSANQVPLQIIISGYLLWEILIRSQSYILKSHMEDVLAKNLGYLLVSPLTDSELGISYIILSFLMTVASITPAAINASKIFLDVYISIIGIIIAVMILVLLGWSIGTLISSAVFRFGRPAEILNGLVIVGLAPISCVFYPISILPTPLSLIARITPTANVFEALREASNSYDRFLSHIVTASIGTFLLSLLSSAVFIYSCRNYRLSGRALCQ